jgi:hypothetical protein
MKRAVQIICVALAIVTYVAIMILVFGHYPSAVG